MAMFTDQELMIIAIALEDEHENHGGKRKWVRDAWKKRDSEGEFAMLFKELLDDGTKFFHYFRMSEGTFNLLLNKLATRLKKQDTHWRKAIPPKERLAVCLRYLATGDSFQTISFSYRMGLSTVYNIVMETCKVICQNLKSTMLPKPTENMWEFIAKDFYEIWNFPNCLGALYGRYITIQAPSSTESLLFNDKNTNSVVLLALVDAHSNFIAVDVGAYSKNSNQGIFANSNLCKSVEEGTLCIPPNAVLPNTSTELPYVIVGDEAFPLKTYLMRPYSLQDLDTSEKIYNCRISRVRKVIDNTFGTLSQKFQIYKRKIQTGPPNIENIVLTTCILHNFIKEYDGNTYTSERYESVAETLENLPLSGGNATSDALKVRETYKNYFNSEVGSVPWQEKSNQNDNCSVY